MKSPPAYGGEHERQRHNTEPPFEAARLRQGRLEHAFSQSKPFLSSKGWAGSISELIAGGRAVTERLVANPIGTSSGVACRRPTSPHGLTEATQCSSGSSAARSILFAGHSVHLHHAVGEGVSAGLEAITCARGLIAGDALLRRGCRAGAQKSRNRSYSHEVPHFSLPHPSTFAHLSKRVIGNETRFLHG